MYGKNVIKWSLKRDHFKIVTFNIEFYGRTDNNINCTKLSGN